MRERDGKHIRAALQELYRDTAVIWNSTDGLFSHKVKPFALLDPHNDKLPSNIKWHLAAVAEAGIDRDAIRLIYQARAKTFLAASDVEWSG